MSSRFITGDGFAAACGHVLDASGLRTNEAGQDDWWFCKSDFLERFFSEVAPDRPFVLVSHNSDRTIGRRFARRLRRPDLVAWLTANAGFSHRKLYALPLGVANREWPHGDVAALRAAQEAEVPKSRLFDASFEVATNPRERRRCLEETGLRPEPRASFPEYLRRLASSYFCIAPRGNGIDTHRTWEALYLRSIPVVTRSTVSDQHADLPLLVLRDWSEFRRIEFSRELYERLWGRWDPEVLGLERYLDRLRDRLEAGYRRRL